MQQNFNYPYMNPNMYNMYPQNANPNAVNINIVAPQAYSGVPYNVPNSNNFPIYGTNPMNSMNYPYNYNNSVNLQDKQMKEMDNLDLKKKTPSAEKPTESKKKEEEPKTKIFLTDDYVKSLENYMNDDNPKIRLIGATELLERFKEDPNRKDNPSLVPLLNKALRDNSPSVRFLALTMLQTGYSTGDDETVQILKEMQTQDRQGLNDDALRAAEILLKMSGKKAEVA
ncbi:HEAT repeat domain-containing protein [bacterium]|nr:HEAT repeat domain-containing protein [bacterium]